MNKEEERLSTSILSLDRKSHYSICVKGNIVDRKAFILTLMEEHSFAEGYVDAFIYPSKMKQIDKLLVDELRLNDLSTNYTKMIKLDRYLKITIACIKNGFIHEDEVVEGDTMYHVIALHLKDGIQYVSNWFIRDGEMDDIA